MSNDTFKLIIHDVKNIKHFEHKFSLDSGIYIISSENGNGKSTILSAISQLIGRKMDFGTGLNKDPMRRKPNNGAYIQYEYNETINKYEFIPGSNQWSMNRTDISRITFDGFCELSVIYGTRFLYRRSAIKNLEKKIQAQINTATLADNWITEKLGKIIKNDIDFYKGKLKKIDKTKLKGQIGGLSQSKHKNIYVLDISGNFVFPYEFSTGENLVLGLLDFLNQFRKIKAKKKRVILIDEIEIGLHPTAQKNLLSVLNELIVDEHKDLCVYLSTHSPTMITNIPDSNNLFELKKCRDILKLLNKPSSSILNTLTNELHKDKYIFVEDIMAKSYIETILHSADYRQKYIVCPIGGYNNVLEVYFQFLPLLREKLISIVDGDAYEDIISKIKTQVQEDSYLFNRNRNSSFSKIEENFNMIKNKQIFDIQIKLENNPEINSLLSRFRIELNNYDKCKNEENKLKIKKELKEIRDNLKNQVQEIIFYNKSKQINCLPVEFLEKFFFKDCIKNDTNRLEFTNKITELLTDVDDRTLQNIINSFAEKSDLGNSDFYKEKYNEFYDQLHSLAPSLITSETFIEKIIAPMIETVYPEKVDKFKRFLLEHIN